jgi:2-hydroxycyclohexanecarboxyl-CoA dehydrogenase
VSAGTFGDATGAIARSLRETLDRVDPRLKPLPREDQIVQGRFANKTALVTGGASGIGMVTSLRLAREGAAVVVCDLNQAPAELVAGDIDAQGGKATALAVDISDPAESRAAVDSLVAAGRSIELLVNCAGISVQADWREVTPSDWDRTMGINLRGTFFLTQAVAEVMAGGAGGSIVNVASGAGKEPRPRGLAYAASKAGLLSVTRSLAQALAEYGIRVNAICPGGVITPMAVSERGWATRGASANVNPPSALGRPMLPQEPAALISFLLSDEARYITGQAINIDDGNNMTS